MSVPPNALGDGLYAAHQKVYPREVAGRFNNLRIAAVIALLGLFYVMPWVQWDGRQAVLFDLPARKFYIFGLTFFPQDFFFLTWLLIIAALSLFFFTAVAGRLWCGYACPQTVWTQTFVWIERWIEGDRAQQMKLDRGAWNWNKIWRKAAKQSLWISFALFTGFTFVGYFTAIRTLVTETAALALGGWEAFWVFFYGFATYGNAGYMREQVCKYMCPYARFQSAMFDRDTLVISYDSRRGEPRGSRSRSVDMKAAGLGACIDCTLCVQVCPTGIDIRKGLQLDCIACAACIDVCDSVMDRMQYPRGLIRYSTQNAIDAKATRVTRPRTVIYGALLLALVTAFGIAVSHRQLVDLDVMRDRNAMYRILDDGRIENVYTLRIINKDTRPHTLIFAVENLEGAVIDSDQGTYEVSAESVATAAIRVRVPMGLTHGSREIRIVVMARDTPGILTTTKSRFIAPVNP
jgi:cytochrome c oxidase accessory protein FixG